ncbi:methylammonium permease 3, partial [Aureobasidium melanogenum]
MDPPEFDPSSPNGGNTHEVDVNAQFAGFEYHAVYIAICGYLVWMIIPGLGLLYGGLARRKSALAMLYQSFGVIGVICFQWMFWGYSLAYSRTAGPFIGDMANFGMQHVTAAPSPGSPYLPEIVFCLYQLLFCICTVMIVVGGAFERGRIIPSLFFGFWWATIVYCPIACWTWNSNGWLYNLPSLDYAGGGPVHVASGCSALAYALVLGKRKLHGHKSAMRPHNLSMVFIGTSMIWFGWYGFNGGSTLNATIRAFFAAWNTNVSAGMGVIGWSLVDMIRNKGKLSLVGACEGAIAGLVGITPAAGYVSVWLAAAIGLITAMVCASLQNVNDWLRIDEGMDVFKLHGIGGMVGAFLTGIFASSSVSLLDGATEAPGAVDGVGVQVARQLADIAAISSYSFTVSLCLLYIMKFIGKFIPFMALRVSEEAEIRGMDEDQFFEEEVGDWSLFEHSGMTHETKLMSTPSTPPNEMDKKTASVEPTTAAA